MAGVISGIEEEDIAPCPPMLLKPLNGEVFLEPGRKGGVTMVNCLSGERVCLPEVGQNEKWGLVYVDIMEDLSLTRVQKSCLSFVIWIHTHGQERFEIAQVWQG
jgi:hypothetical protein